MSRIGRKRSAEKVNLETGAQARAHSVLRMHRIKAVQNNHPTQIMLKFHSQHRQELHVRFYITITLSPYIMLIFNSVTATHVQKEKKGDQPLHPSWAAKKQLKEKQNPGIVAPQGTKIVF